MAMSERKEINLGNILYHSLMYPIPSLSPYLSYSFLLLFSVSPISIPSPLSFSSIIYLSLNFIFVLFQSISPASSCINFFFFFLLFLFLLLFLLFSYYSSPPPSSPLSSSISPSSVPSFISLISIIIMHGVSSPTVLL